MKLCLVGPGIMSIPPVGWGAVEILIWDYYNELKKQGHAVTIINKIRVSPRDQMNPTTDYCKELIKEINNGNYDFVHLHYDCLFHIVPFLICKKVGLTSHYPYIDQPAKHLSDGYSNIFKFMCSTNNYINFVLADKDLQFIIEKGLSPTIAFKLENGISVEHFKFTPNPLYFNKTIYLGQVNERKGQYKYCHLKNIDIIGPISGDNNHRSLQNYKGAWTRSDVHSQLTNYGNLLLLSKGEADPLVVKEAIVAGLGVVINETSAKNLKENEFITIIKDTDMDKFELIQQKLDENRERSLKMREEIRSYGINKFGWGTLMERYIKHINSI